MIAFSVVINTHNRADLLEDTLRGLTGLRYPAFEVVVVNGPSTDATSDVLARWRGRIKIVGCPVPNLAVSRNLGIEAAAGDVVAFIDDDAVPHPDWLTELCYFYADPRVGGAGGFTLDHTGVRFQARKTVCDRFGNAFERPDDYDERVLNRAGTSLYPSLLGTNASYRAAALRAVGGFDPVFAYFLDETDVCLRLVDAAWRVVYAPEALVFHQLAPSAERDGRRVPRSILRQVISQSYFIWRHGTRQSLEESGRQLAVYEARMRADNARLLADQAIDLAHKVRLDEELSQGLSQGRAAAFAGETARVLAAAPAFLPFGAGARSVAVLARQVSARLQDMVAGLVAGGWTVHLLCEGEALCSHFHAGVWRHAVVVEPGAGEALAGARDIPLAVADWCVAVAGRFEALQSFRFDAVASCVRELPGAAVLGRVGLLIDDGRTEVPVEARDRVLWGHFHVGKLIALESRAMAAKPVAADAAAALALLGNK